MRRSGDAISMQNAAWGSGPRRDTWKLPGLAPPNRELPCKRRNEILPVLWLRGMLSRLPGCNCRGGGDRCARRIGGCWVACAEGAAACPGAPKKP